MNWIESLLNYYDRYARRFPWRGISDPYRIWISEIMLQQTRTETVISYYRNFLERFPDVFALKSASDEELYKAWEGLGYYSRARNLRKAAGIIVDTYNGVFPDNYDLILTLPGIGLYTAGAIASIAFSLPYPAVDGNVMRVYARLFAESIDVKAAKTKETVDARLREFIPKNRPGAFNQALMDLGATICLPNAAPKCEACPIASFCLAHKSGKETAFPIAVPQKPKRLVNKTVFVLETDSGPFGYLRNEPGVLNGLYQLPDTEELLTAGQALAYLKAKGLSVLGELLQYDRKHLFTHIEWDMRVFKCSVKAEAIPAGWVVLSEKKHALPTAYKKCLEPIRPKTQC